ncbi:MAG: hypothetical protein HFH31_04405 [Bacilli bacterium]|nr:hypothetical protein [Bacilli bacterium]
MSSIKVEVIIKPIYDALIHQYWTIYEKYPNKSQIEFTILEELLLLKENLTVKEALYFSNLMLHIEDVYISKEQLIWRKLVFCHFVFLFKKRVFSFDSWLLGLILDTVTKENIEEIYFLEILSDKKIMKELFEQVIIIDYNSSLKKQYEIDFGRIKRMFGVMCKRIEEDVKALKNDNNLEILKDKIVKKLKEYHINKLFKRS